MRTLSACFLVTSVLLGTVFVSGCAPSVDAPAAAPVAQESDASIPADLTSLSAADREAALAQKICPVSGQPLGSMGVPPKVHVDDRDVFICCEACETPLLADPAKHLAKLDK